MGSVFDWCARSTNGKRLSNLAKKRYHGRNRTRNGFCCSQIPRDRLRGACHGNEFSFFRQDLLFSRVRFQPSRLISSLLVTSLTFLRTSTSPTTIRHSDTFLIGRGEAGNSQMAASPLQYMVTKNTKFEAKLSRNLISDPGDQLLGYDACIEKQGRNINYRLIVLGLESIYLTDNPPKSAQLEQPYLYYRDILRAELVRLHRRSLSSRTLVDLDRRFSRFSHGNRTSEHHSHASTRDDASR